MPCGKKTLYFHFIYDRYKIAYDLYIALYFYLSKVKLHLCVFFICFVEVEVYTIFPRLNAANRKAMMKINAALE